MLRVYIEEEREDRPREEKKNILRKDGGKIFDRGTFNGLCVRYTKINVSRI